MSYRKGVQTPGTPFPLGQRMLKYYFSPFYPLIFELLKVGISEISIIIPMTFNLEWRAIFKKTITQSYEKIHREHLAHE